MTGDIQTFALGEKPNAADVGRLVTFLKDAQGSAVRLDASETEVISSLCLQAMLSAEQSWLAIGQAFEVAGIGPACRDNLSILGVSDMQFAAEVQA